VIPNLHIVTDDEILGRQDFVRLGIAVLEAGGEGVAIHLRGPRTPGGILYTLARELTPAAAGSGAMLLANDRVDVALALDLPGAHLGQRSIPPSSARQLLGSGRVLGLSVHGVAEAREAEAREGKTGEVDFLIVGTIFPSPSHPGGTPGGVGRIQDIRAVTGLPLLAIGGITPGRIDPVLTAGATGVAVRGGIWDAPDPVAALEEYRSELRKGQGN